MGNEVKDEKKKRKWPFKKTVKRLLTVWPAILVGVLLGVVICVVNPLKRWAGSGPITTNVDASIAGDNYLLTISKVEEILKSASDLVSMKYCYKDADTYENYKQIFGKKLPFTTDKVVFTYEGVVSVGIDLSTVTYEINNEDKVITITLPEVAVLSNEIDASSFEIPYESDSIFNSTGLGDYTELIDGLKKNKEEQVKKNTELMTSAKESTENVLKGFLTASESTKDYTVKFK